MSDTLMNSPDNSDRASGSVPPRWYREVTEDPPFRLTTRYSSNVDSNPAVNAVAIFPWSYKSIETLWQGDLNKDEHINSWRDMISEWSGACAVGGLGKVVIYSLRPSLKPIFIKLPLKESPDHDPCNVAWAMSPDLRFEPLLVFSAAKLVYVFNAKQRQMMSYIRGHGGSITSIAVHPVHASIFCTTSQDFSTRIYDLLFEPIKTPNNPHWPPSTAPSRAGAAHGLHMTEREGTGIGRCVAVLAGGRAGGHLAAVLCAAFHPSLPLLATCGVDRVVKIWRLPSLEGERISREDKPLFSSSQVHKARVLSINWISQDILLSHSAPAIMRRKGWTPTQESSEQDSDSGDDDNRDNDTEADPETAQKDSDEKDPVQEDPWKFLYEEPGTLVLWQWLGLDRFFPPNLPYQTILRGCASDYQESSSFKLICIYSLPMATRNLYVYQSPTHDPIVLIPSADGISILNLTHLSPRYSSRPPPFPLDEEDMISSMQKTTLNDEEDDEEETTDIKPPWPNVPEQWKLKVSNTIGGHDFGKSEAMTICAMGVGGGLIVGAGVEGSVWMWVGQTPPANTHSLS